MDKNLKRIKDFFDADIKIKNELYKLAPSSEDEYDEESKMKYVDKVMESIKYIKSMIGNIEKEFNISMEDSTLSNFFEACNQKLLNFNYRSGDIKKLNQQCLSDMDENLVSEVNESCFGYSVFSSPHGLVEKCKTVNELLHVYHSYIVNNEHFYKSIPKLCEPKTNREGYDINLYGMDNELAKNIFDKFPLDMDCGDVDILALENRILMMLRDRGHALTVELIQGKEKNVSVNYFIPKICNVEMVNKLKGITKVDGNSKFAKGMFDSPDENIIQDLFTFIDGVPMDKDMVFTWEAEKFGTATEINEETEETIAPGQPGVPIVPIELEVQDEDRLVITQDGLNELSKNRRFSKVRETFKNVIGKVKSIGKEYKEYER